MNFRCGSQGSVISRDLDAHTLSCNTCSPHLVSCRKNGDPSVNLLSITPIHDQTQPLSVKRC
jgi:hypothetical protein